MIQLANVKLIAAIICFSLFIRGHSALAVVIYRAAADVHKVLVEKRAVNFWRWAVDGNVNFFIGVFALSVGVYINSCSDYWAYKVGLVKTSSDKDNDSECVAAGAALAAIGWAGTMLNAYGRSHGWFTDNSASSAHAPKMKRGASISSDRHYSHLFGNMFIDISQQYDSATDSILLQYDSLFHDNITFTSQLYSNASGEYDSVGHMLTFYNGIIGTTQTAIAPDDTIHDVATALAKFDGINQAFSDDAMIYGGNSSTLNKRSSDSFWISFTGWGGDTGYLGDLLDWDEFDRAARAEAGDADLFVLNVDGCSNSQYCYVVKSKFCYAAGFSPNQGIADAIVGEVYIQSFGGLDGDCMSG